MLQEDAHIADVQFMGSDNKALFGVFDGHGGREVAVYCGEQYPNILAKNDVTIEGGNKDEAVKEWLRTSFLKVDDQIRTEEG